MSESGKYPIRDFSEFDNMSTEALEEILRLDFQSDESSDMDVMLYIMEVIAKREKEQLTGRFTDVHSAWDSFKINYLPCADGESIYEDEQDETAPDQRVEIAHYNDVSHKSGQRKGRHLRRSILIAAIVAALLLGGTITAYAFGFDLWGTIAKWTTDTFGFASTDSVETPQLYGNIQDALSDYGITEPLTPSWLPEDYELKSIIVSDTPAKMNFMAIYTNNNNELLISITNSINGNTGTYEKDGNNITKYESNGIEHYIMSNEGRLNAVWLYNSYECSISGSITEPEIEKMIDSIYER
ncbi:MAG: DUF4367 domain-containing protein [Clostridia bacterium]|nr:DUF4367 domain-containing protein [Clostridia bacterium]